MQKEYLSAPLPFMGQKRRFASEFKKVLKRYPDHAVFVDLFGGSGLLSHITKREKPEATVVYNDFDNYRRRLENIGRTNRLLAELREMLKDCPRQKLIRHGVREQILERIGQEEESGFVDYITLSASLLFSMKYVLSLEALRKESLYNTVRKSDYGCDGYLDGLVVTSCDYRVLFERYKNVPGVVFLVDPPYLSTETGTYNMQWRLGDYLDVLGLLQGTAFVYFTSDKSSIIELCRWMGEHQGLGDPFRQAGRAEVRNRMNFNSAYTDIMLYQ